MEYLEKRCENKQIHVIQDQLSRDKCYLNSLQEKTNRASLKSSVERYLNPDSIVILDSLNYIKGYRYELYCISKHLKTSYCVVLCDTGVDVARAWNSAREPSQSYTQQVFDELVVRLETPDSRNRWDQPLFILYPDDPLPCEDIYSSLFLRKPPPPNQSTQTQPLSESNFLHQLDRLTQDVVRCAVEAQHSSQPGEQISVPSSRVRLVLSRPVTMAELRRLRKQFISYTKLHPVEDHSHIPTLFVEYLNSTVVV